MATISEALAIAIQHHQAGRLQAAEQIYRKILQAQPNNADAWHLLGRIAYQVGKHDLAIEHIAYAIRLAGEWAAFHQSLGDVYRALGRLPEAIACYHRALELSPDFAEAHNNLANALKDQGALEEAIACYRRALELKPDFAEAYSNLGTALSERDELTQAVACHRRALELKPDRAETYNSLGLALQAQGRFAEASAGYQRAIELEPHHAEAHYNRSMLRLLAGDFEQGLAEYAWRWETRRKPFILPPFPHPIWDGRPLEGRRLLLHGEQGYGDTLQFIRYAAQAKQRGAGVLVGCTKPLLRIVRSCRFVDQVVYEITSPQDFDVYCPLLSMPQLMKTTLGSVPHDVPYLFADPPLVEQWRGELGPIAGFKIGIAWRGNPKHRNDRARSFPLSCFQPLGHLPGIHLVSLQKGAGEEDLPEVRDRFPITELGSRLNDFMDMAAVMVNLDLVITCDTAVAHLAGALGVPVWVALPLVPDWRWMLDRSDSPWYPTMRLFRQDRRGDWQGVFQRIEAALGEQLAASAGHKQ
jgi:tetratricopeptide (TPR) repeat protein